MRKKFLVFLLITGVLILCLLFINCKQIKPYDICIKNARIISGDGNPWFKADIGIKNEKISFIGRLSEKQAPKVINAEGLYVTPGFIDIHTHADRGIVETPTANNYLLQGVTTVVGGNCGGHQYPLSELYRKLEKSGIAINFCSLIGHNTIREKAMGLKMESPTDEELTKMKELVRQEMKSGAIGLSTGLAYMPGIYSDTGEIIELVSVVAEYEGIYASHIRDQGEKITESIEEAIEIGEKNNIPVQISHIKLCIEQNWNKPEIITEPVEEARKKGIEVTTDQYPYTATSSGFSSSFPDWSLEGGDEKLKKRLENPEKYNRIKNYIIKKRLTSIKGINKLETIYIANYKKNPEFEGKNLKQILELQGKEPTISTAGDLIINIQKNGGASCVFFQMIEEDVETLMKLDYNMIASDGAVIKYGQGVPHCRSYGTFPKVIHRYVKEKKILKLQEAVRKMTSLPAQTLRLKERGLVKKNMFADLVIFDLNKIKDTATYQNPHSYPEGIKYIIVNGIIAAKNGKPTKKLPGRILYGKGKNKKTL